MCVSGAPLSPCDVENGSYVQLGLQFSFSAFLFGLLQFCHSVFIGAGFEDLPFQFPLLSGLQFLPCKRCGFVYKIVDIVVVFTVAVIGAEWHKVVVLISVVSHCFTEPSVTSLRFYF